MAIDSKKMNAWAGQGQEPPEKKGQAHPPPAKGGGEKNKGKGKGEGEDHENEEPQEEPEGEEEEAAEGDLEERFPTLFQKMEDAGHDFEDAAGLVDREALTAQDELPPDEKDMLTEALTDLPGDLIEAIKDEAKDISWEDAQSVGHALEAGEHVEDPELVGAFLFHAARAA